MDLRALLSARSRSGLCASPSEISPREIDEQLAQALHVSTAELQALYARTAKRVGRRLIKPTLA